jgi:hypothetical protein
MVLKSRRLLLSIAGFALSVGGASDSGAFAGERFPAEWQPLVQALRQAGYDMRFSQPPGAGAYGATDSRKKIVWVSPISVDLGIGRQTLIHEAVHAAQACPTGKYEAIGWSVTLPNAVDRSIEGILYRKYPHKKFPVEREAFFMQSHPNAFGEIIKALKQRCR